MPAHSFKLHCIEGRLDKLLDGLFVLGIPFEDLINKYPIRNGIHVSIPFSIGGIQDEVHASFQTLFFGNYMGYIFRTADYRECVIASDDPNSSSNYIAYRCTSGEDQIRAFFDACNGSDSQSIIIDDVNSTSFSLKTYVFKSGGQFQLEFDNTLI